MMTTKPSRELTKGHGALHALRIPHRNIRPSLDSEIGDLATVTLGDLSKLYRTVSFCNAVEISVTDYYGLVDLLGVDRIAPFAPPTRPDVVLSTFNTIETIARVKSSGLDISALSYLLCTNAHTIFEVAGRWQRKFKTRGPWARFSIGVDAVVEGSGGTASQ